MSWTILGITRLSWPLQHLVAYQLSLRSCIQPIQTGVEFPHKWRFPWKIIYKWVIFHCHLCVPESKPSLVKHEDPRVEFSLPGWNSTMASGATECREPFIPCRTSSVDEDSNNKNDHTHSVVGLRRYAGSSGLIRRQIMYKWAIVHSHVSLPEDKKQKRVVNDRR